MQFMRYIPTIAEVTKTIVQFVPPTMYRLMRYNLPEKVIIETSYDKLLGEFDYITTDVEMAYHFCTTVDTIPLNFPYISVPDDVMKQRVLPATSMKRVGLCWAGGERDKLNQRSYDERRSIDLGSFAPLGKISWCRIGKFTIWIKS